MRNINNKLNCSPFSALEYSRAFFPLIHSALYVTCKRGDHSFIQDLDQEQWILLLLLLCSWQNTAISIVPCIILLPHPPGHSQSLPLATACCFSCSCSVLLFITLKCDPDKLLQRQHLYTAEPFGPGWLVSSPSLWRRTRSQEEEIEFKLGNNGL